MRKIISVILVVSMVAFQLTPIYAQESEEGYEEAQVVVTQGSSAAMVSSEFGCDQLPCTFRKNGLNIKAEGYVQQTMTSPETVFAQIIINVDGSFVGGLQIYIVRRQDKATSVGYIYRSHINPAGLPLLNFPFNVETDIDLNPGELLPTLSINDAVIMSLFYVFMDQRPDGIYSSLPEAESGGESNTSSGGTSSPSPEGSEPDQRSAEYSSPLGCSGPLQGHFIVPVRANKNLQRCCMKHDACYRVGGDSAQRSKCNDELFKCMLDAVPVQSIPWSTIVMGNMMFWGWLFGDSFVERDSDCTCLWELSDKDLDRIESIDYDWVAVEQGTCTDARHQPQAGQCKPNDCFVWLGSTNPATGKPMQAGSATIGHCGPAPQGDCN